jgi:PIN domain nuclease of toxin-antitoxin system
LILDTTYLLPLARITVDTDLLRVIADRKVSWKLEDVTVSMISIFELQAKAAKLMVPTEFVVDAVKAIFGAFNVESFYRPEIIKVAYKVKKLIPDYVDCVIVATAIVLKEDLATEDSQILSNRGVVEEEYGVSTLSYKELVRK